MIKKILILLFFIFNINNLLPYTHLEVPLILSDEYSGRMQLTFGLDVSATNGFDSALGEKNAPNIFPPQFHAAFEYYDSLYLKQIVWTYKDFRPIVDSLHFYVQYWIAVKRDSGSLLIFQWGILPQYIDSARITDREEDLDLVNFNMKGPKRIDTVTNRSLNYYYVKVWYNNPDAGIVYERDENNSEFNVFPTPVSGDKIIIKSRTPGFSYQLFTETGIKISEGKTDFDREEISTGSLSRGVYLIIIKSGTFYYVKKVVRI